MVEVVLFCFSRADLAASYTFVVEAFTSSVNDIVKKLFNHSEFSVWRSLLVKFSTPEGVSRGWWFMMLKNCL